MFENLAAMSGLVGELQLCLKARRETLATAESCTGGLLAFLLTRAPGSSEIYLGGASTYANSAKEALLGIESRLLTAHGAVSAQVAEAMAAGIRGRLNSTWALAVTGIAGPGGGTPQKPVGTVFVALSGPLGTSSAHLLLTGNRDSIREQSARNALALLHRAVQT